LVPRFFLARAANQRPQQATAPGRGKFRHEERKSGVLKLNLQDDHSQVDLRILRIHLSILTRCCGHRLRSKPRGEYGVALRSGVVARPLSPGAATAQSALPPRSGYLQRPEFVRSIAQMRAICPSETLIPVKASSPTRARKSLQGRHSTWRKS
jgi:hypothetical protein